MPLPKHDPKKLEAERLSGFLHELLREEENKYCADCEAKQPRWASWNLGVFLCIRCAGLHRNLGVHISKVKSVNLDSWTAEQVQSMRVMGNAKAKAVYEAELPQMFRRPQSDQSLEAFIRAKYESRRYILRDWQPPPIRASDLPEHAGMNKNKGNTKTHSNSHAAAALPIPKSSPKTREQPKPSTPPAQSLLIDFSTPPASAVAVNTPTLMTTTSGIDESMIFAVAPTTPAIGVPLGDNANGDNLTGLGVTPLANDAPGGGNALDQLLYGTAISAPSAPTADSDKKSKEDIMALFGSCRPQPLATATTPIGGGASIATGFGLSAADAPSGVFGTSMMMMGAHPSAVHQPPPPQQQQPVANVPFGFGAFGRNGANPPNASGLDDLLTQFKL